MNGILYQMSAVDVWMCAGGGFPYNSAFSSAIGGYPKGARVLMASGNGYWVSTTDNNVTDPDTGGAGWASDDSNAITALTGDVTATGPGSAVATLAASGVTAGSYIGADITVDAKGRVTAASNGFTSGSNANGYWEKSPTGHIHQWGSVTVNVGASLYGTATLPVAFASHFDSIVINSQYTIGNSTLLTPNNLPIPASAPHSGSLSQYDWHFESNVSNAFSGNLVFSFVADGY